MLKLKPQYFGHLMRRTDSFEKTLMLGKIEGRKRRGRQDEMVKWHHQLDGHEFAWALGVGDGQGGLACCILCGHKELDTTELLGLQGDPISSFWRNAKAETLVLWPPHAKSWLIGKDSDAGRDWGQEEKGATEDEMAGWHHGLDGREFEWTPGVGDGQGGLACCDSWGRKESDTTERLELNWTELNYASSNAAFLMMYSAYKLNK